MKALIDYDIVLHRVGYTTDNDAQWIARARTNEMIEGILTDTNADEYQGWLSDSRENNFRTKMYPLYKATRQAPRPVHYDYIKQLLIEEWGAKIAHNMEADDALGIAQDKELRIYSGDEGTNSHIYDTIICSIDKDLLQIPGFHYNFVKKEHKEIGNYEAIRNFYEQILIGDTSDNVPGVSGIGKVKAPKYLEGAETELELFGIVKEIYLSSFKAVDGWSMQDVLEKLLTVGRLLKIRQREDEGLWEFPTQD